MEAIDYVKLFKLDQENYDFKREEFISELGKEFLDYCQTTTLALTLRLISYIIIGSRKSLRISKVNSGQYPSLR